MMPASEILVGHTLSAADQPLLVDLFRVVQSEEPLTLVVGAGVSMDAGLPSWPSLLQEMARNLGSEPLRRMAEADASDPMRKAEYVMQMALSATPKSTNEIVRDALYPEAGEVAPGELADSIARFVAARKANVRIITTNFDEVLEVALSNYFPPAEVKSFSLPEVNDWNDHMATGVVGVLHVHGLLVTNDRPHKEPVILTESHFLRYGRQVRAVIADELIKYPVLFAGVSMSDPNLVGPLWDVSSSEDTTSGGNVAGKERFVLVVPGMVSGARDQAEAVEYTVEAAQYLDRKLGLSPLFLKSYSQLIQLVSDLSLAVERPVQYSKRVPASAGQSLRYGKRFQRILGECYTNIGCPPRRDSPSGPAADNLSEALYRELNAHHGPVTFLKEIARKHRLSAKDWEAPEEHFALFLWLRARGAGRATAPYALRLTGTSATRIGSPGRLIGASRSSQEVTIRLLHPCITARRKQRISPRDATRRRGAVSYRLPLPLRVLARRRP